MNFLIASDIHGSFETAQIIIDRYKKGNFDKILLLGDILYNGARNVLPSNYSTRDVVMLLNQYKDKIISVRGNCDSEVDQMALEFPITADYMLMPFDDIMVFLSHGHIYGLDRIPPIGSCDVLLCGHTHIAGMKQIGDLLYCNPGSATLPKGSDIRSYMTYENRTFYWKNLLTDEVFLQHTI